MYLNNYQYIKMDFMKYLQYMDNYQGIDLLLILFHFLVIYNNQYYLHIHLYYYCAIILNTYHMDIMIH